MMDFDRKKTDFSIVLEGFEYIFKESADVICGCPLSKRPKCEQLIGNYDLNGFVTK